MRTSHFDKTSTERVSPDDEPGVDEEIERLVKKHGDNADIVAAHNADELFRKGDVLGGRRWLAIFRKLAMANLDEEDETGTV